MTKLKLSKRLQTIANLVPSNSIVADIGCDHGLLDIYLTLNNISKKAYACDIVDGAIKIVQENKKKYKANNVYVRQGNGLDVITSKDKVNTIIMSGLGNITITNILNNNINKLDNIDNIIIQSNTNVFQIRKYLISIGYYIENEKMVLDNKIIYTVILFKKGKRNYTKKEIFLGPILLQNKDNNFKNEVKKIIKKNEKIISSLPSKRVIKKLKLKYINRKLKKEIF